MTEAVIRQDGLPPCGLRRAITITAVLIVILELMDVTIVNVALPNIQGGLSATPSSIVWIITAYTTASALMTPLTGFLAKKIGRRRLLIIDIPIFIVFSVLCGFSTNMFEIITLRFLQGMAAGTMIPLAEASLLDAYPCKERSKAMSFFGVGVMLGPILGPFLGGYIDQYLNWRWIFFVNVPIGFIAFALVSFFIKDTKKQKVSPDYLALTCMWIAILAFEIILSQGNKHSWFQSGLITVLACVGVVTFIGFIWKTLAAKVPIVDLRIFKDRNFALGALILFTYGVPLLGAMTMIPLMFNEIYNYPPSTIGLLLLFRGVSALFAVPLVRATQKILNLRVYIVIGLILSAIGSLQFSWLSPQASFASMLIPIFLQGFGTGCIMPTLFAVGFASVPLSITDEASGLFSICRSLGFSFGVTLVATSLDIFKQTAWSNLGNHIHSSNPLLRPWLHKQGLTLHDKTTPNTLANLLHLHSSMIAYNDVFTLIAIITLCMLVVVPFISTAKCK